MSDMDRDTFRHPVILCPSCGNKLDASTSWRNGERGVRAPEDGDFSLCVNCASLLVYGNEARSLHLATEAERQEFDADPVKVGMRNKVLVHRALFPLPKQQP